MLSFVIWYNDFVWFYLYIFGVEAFDTKTIDKIAAHAHAELKSEEIIYVGSS